MENIQFKCGYDEKCEFKGNYLRAMDHLKNCDKVGVKCSLGCG